MANNIYDIIQGINQAAANAYDGAHDERFVRKGEDKKVGLKREEGCPINDSRVMDGFKVRFQGSNVIVSYQAELTMKEYHDSKFESSLEQSFKDIVSYLKKEYKKITTKTLALTSQDKAKYHCQNLSQIRTWVTAYKTYKIGGTPELGVDKDEAKEKLGNAVKKWLAIGKETYPGSEKPKNITRKGEQ